MSVTRSVRHIMAAGDTSGSQPENEAPTPPQPSTQHPSASVFQADQSQPAATAETEVLPPPPTMAQVLAMIEQGRQTNTLLLQQLVQNTATLGTTAGGNGAAVNQSSSRLGEFMRTRPPTFASAADPLDADDWLRTVESKLIIA